MSRLLKRPGKPRDLLVVGDLCLDVDVFTHPHPMAGKRESRMTINGGGSAGNVAFTANGLGLKVGLATPIADDDFGMVLEALVRNRHENVRYYPLRGADNVTCAIVSLVNRQGSRRAYYQKNRGKCSLEGLLEIASKYSHVHLSGYTLELFNLDELLGFITSLREVDVSTSFDLFPRIGVFLESEPKVYQMLREFDFVFGNLREFKILALSNGIKGIQKFIRANQIRAIVKMGSKGSLYVDSSEVFKSPSICVKPINLKGAGDCYVAAYLASSLEGLSIEKSMDRANEAAGLHVSGRL